VTFAESDTAPRGGAAAAAAAELRFYGRRHGRRLRPQRRGLFETLLPQLALTLPPDGVTLQPASLFPRRVEAVWLEVGFGGGEHLLAQARAHPGLGLIGCEPFVNGMATLLADVAARPVDNVRLWPEDARLLLPRLATASLARVFVLFPDPWPKPRHHRRRFISEATLGTLARVVADDGELRVATDHAAYAAWTLAHVRGSQAFRWLAERPADWREPPDDWVATRYQRKAEQAGARPIYLSFARIPRVPAAPPG
jgi:tRNA (guanine-N7-)-methyltransferase